MTIDEALEQLRILHSSPLLYETENYRDAIRLSIEALKRCQILAKNDTYWAARPLQGETK